MAKRLFLALVLLAAIFGGIFGWKFYAMKQQMAAQSGPPPPVVAVSQVRQDAWIPAINAVGSVAAVSGIEVTNEVAGKVSTIHFDSGETAEQGDLLLQLDDASDQATLEGLVAERRLAELKFERVASLFPKKSVSQSEYDEARALLDGATAKVTAQQALIDKKQIRAPFSGQLGIRRVDVGEFLSPGSAIVPLEQLDPIHVDFSLPERELARVADGQEIEVRVQAWPDAVFPGVITAIDPGVNSATRSFRLQARLANPDAKLRPGMFAEIRVLMPQAQEVLTIPATSISYNPYGDFVFVVAGGDEGNVVKRRQIDTGATRGDRVAVSAGLVAGERVVSSGQVKLRDGQAVQADEKPSPGERGGGKDAATAP
jgi:membrane fusion protein (multidrug efflux system)